MELKIYGITERKKRKISARIGLSRAGVLRLNREAVKLLGLTAERNGVKFGEDSKTGVMYLMCVESDDALRMRHTKTGKSSIGSMLCNGVEMVDIIAKLYDVEFSDRVKSVAFDIRKTNKDLFRRCIRKNIGRCCWKWSWSRSVGVRFMGLGFKMKILFN